MSANTVVPEVLWAQRSSDSNPEKNYVYLTLNVPDVPEKDAKLDLQPTSVEFNGRSETKKVTYAVKLDLFAEIVPEETKKSHTDKNIELVLRKKELKEEFWPRLLKEKGKVHFLRTDFDKWVDEDEQEGNPDDDDFMSKMGGMGGMGGAGGASGFEGIDFSKLGAGAGGIPADDEADESDADEALPELEGEEEEEDVSTGAPSSKKIEEVQELSA